MIEAKAGRLAVARLIIPMMISPGSVLKSAISGVPWFFSLFISAIAFGLFFLQTGLDLYKTGQKDLDFAIMSAGAGAVYGATVIPLLGAIIWALLKLARTKKPAGWAVSLFCLSYSGALVYGLLGIAFSLLLDWRTSVAFGVTGVLWATGPIIATIREMTGGRNLLAIILATLAGTVILVSWAMLGSV